MAFSARRSAGALCLALAMLLALQSPVSAGSRSKVPTKAPKLSRQQLVALVDKYAAKYGIPRYIAHNLVAIESGWRQNAVSYRGARGIMQLMRRTARDLRVNRNDPRQNIEGGMRYLRILYNRFGRWDLALAAYHSGPRNVIRYKGIPPKSRSYVRRILRKPETAVAAAEMSTETSQANALAVAAKPAAQITATPPAFERRQHVTVSGTTTITVREALRDGQVVWRAEETISVQDGVRTAVVREFRLVDGLLTMVNEETIVLGAAADDNPGQGESDSK